VVGTTPTILVIVVTIGDGDGRKCVGALCDARWTCPAGDAGTASMAVATAGTLPLDAS